MKTNINIFKKPVFMLLLLTFSIIATAQKLPKVQTVSLRLPDNVKIDGKATEWDNKFQAYNANTGLFYTMANDNDRLYLIIQATDAMVIRKIMAGSVTLSINLSAANKSAKDVSITYPVFGAKDKPNINLKNKPKLTKDGMANRNQLDSFMYAANKELGNKSKEIKVFGIKDIDTSLSVYNEDGIRAVSLFDNQIAYTYELVIPLKYIALTNTDKFDYTIQINGADNYEGIRIIDYPGGGRAMYWDGERPSESDVQFMHYPTNFSDSYTLVKN